MRYLIISCLLLFCFTIGAQEDKQPADFGYRHLLFEYENDTVDILISSNPTDTQKKKPLLLFVQGSMPQPLLKYDERGGLNTFPFGEQIFTKDYHLAIINKPGVPVICHMKDLEQPYFTYKDSTTGAFPEKYCQNNHLDYYVNRNKAVLDFLAQKEWVDESKIVVAGHSEGVLIAYKMALDKAHFTHLILLNAGLAGRIMSIITNSRQRERSKADYEQTEEFFSYWKSLVATNPTDLSDDCSKSDSHKATASFSFPYRKHIEEIDIPVFFGYGTKDESVLLMDYLRVQTIRAGKKNFHFKSYYGWEHNFFGFNEDGSLNYEDYNFNTVALDFYEWLKTN